MLDIELGESCLCLRVHQLPRMSEREPPAPPPAAVATPTKNSTPRPLPKQPATDPPPPHPPPPSSEVPEPSEEPEVELIDYGDEEDPDDYDSDEAIQDGDGADQPDQRRDSGLAIQDGGADQPVQRREDVGRADPRSNDATAADPRSNDATAADPLQAPTISASVEESPLPSQVPPAPSRRPLMNKLKSVLVQPSHSMALTLPAAPRRKTVWRRLSFAPATALPPKAIRPKPPATPSGRGNYPKAAELCEATAVIASQEDAVSPKWQEKKSRHWWRKDAARHRTNSGGVNGPPPAKPKARDAFLKRLAGRCFKCLASDHLVADCRDPVRCLRCRRSGHTSSSCPARRPRTISPNLRSRLKFPPESIHSRITFPPLPSTSKPTTPSTLDAVEMEHTPGFPSRRQTLGRTALVMTDAMSRAAARLLAHAVEVTMPEEGYRPSTLEVAYALSGQLHVPRLNIRVSRRNSDTFLAEFKMAPERDRAVGRGSIDIGGSSLPIRPWRSVGGAVERVWWYHAKVTLEKVPMEAWNEDGVRLILGDSCILDRLDSYSVEREQSEFLTCWVWMEDPDDLPRAVEFSLFAAGAGALSTSTVSHLRPASRPRRRWERRGRA